MIVAGRRGHVPVPSAAHLASWVADFDKLDDALSALMADSFQETRTASEALGATHFLFECRQV